MLLLLTQQSLTCLDLGVYCRADCIILSIVFWLFHVIFCHWYLLCTVVLVVSYNLYSWLVCRGSKCYFLVWSCYWFLYNFDVIIYSFFVLAALCTWLHRSLWSLKLVGDLNIDCFASLLSAASCKVSLEEWQNRIHNVKHMMSCFM